MLTKLDGLILKCRLYVGGKDKEVTGKGKSMCFIPHKPQIIRITKNAPVRCEA